MTITESRPSESDWLEPPKFPSPAPPRPPGAGWWAGTAVGLGVVAVAVSLVALTVSLGSTGSSRTGSPAASGQVAAAVAGASPAAQPYATADVTVNLTEYKVGLPASTMTAGTKTLQISNGGTMQHELLVFHPDAAINPASLPLGTDGNVNEDAPGINKISDGDNLDPGQTQTRQLDLTQPGIYVFLCNLPGHYKMGMWTMVTVVAGQTTPAALAAPAATLQEYKVGTSSEVGAGKYTFTINNSGTMQHELLVFHPDASINPANLPLGPDGNVSEDSPGINKISDGDNLDPGKSQTRDIDLTQPGTYVFVCNLPGHYKLGMWTTVTVH